MKKFFTFSAMAVFLSFFATSLFAQAGTGKLAGKIVDGETGEPLIGANIVVLNTSLGAAADLDGRYFILNITPGTYDVQISFVGYSSKVIQEVRIVPNLTYELNESLLPGIDLEEIVVTDRKFFEEKSTNTVKVVDSEMINQLPVRGVENLVSLQAGVVVAEGSGGADGNAEVNVRGGRSNEVLYIVDGIPQNDAYFGGNFSQIANAAIDQIAFQVGGFEAKYGQAQSGVVSVTTKGGSPRYTLFGDVLTSSFTDNYGYNLYTLAIGGPIIPGQNKHTFFISGEKGYFEDVNPQAIPLVIPTVDINQDAKPNNASELHRFTVRTISNFSPFTLRLGATLNFRDRRNYIHSYAKNNSHHNPKRFDDNLTFSAQLSHNVSSNSFWNVNLGYKIYKREEGDGVWFDNLNAYGDTTMNPEISVQGVRNGLDEVGLFFETGRVSNNYNKSENNSIFLDMDFTSQLDNHLIEVGAGGTYNNLRRYTIAPTKVAVDIDSKSYKERLALQSPFFFGYDIYGDKTSATTSEVLGGLEVPTAIPSKNPVILYGYVQDRFELDDIVLNFGVRFDYFDTQEDIVANEELPFAAGDPNIFDAPDFIRKDPEFYVSPRLGFGFPVTSTTVFHAQYGKFIQTPNLIDVVTNINRLNDLTWDSNYGVNTGNVDSEITTQYEIGFRQVLGDNAAALNITAFYKNIKGLVNNETVFYQRADGGQVLRYYRPFNSDFGTVKGLMFTLNVSRFSFFSLNVDYTWSLAEGTGSSTNSSTTAAFRNPNGETPKVIAPLDFDQTHTGIINFNMVIPDGEYGILQNTRLNLLFSFNSGRPYTPLLTQDITPGGATNLGDTKGYVNSAYGPGGNRLDLKLEKSFKIGSAFDLTPYLWVENVFGSQNAVTVYRTTGSPFTTEYLQTSEGKAKSNAHPDYTDDYIASERNPGNFGIPRLIKLGLKVNFSNIGGL